VTQFNITDLPTRIATKISVDTVTGCWVWRAGTFGGGYGSVRWGSGHNVMAHRLVFHLLADRALPVRSGGSHAGLQLDHLCRNKTCVNPDHLDPVTFAENMRRRYQTYTHCLHGHSLTDESNVRVNPIDGRRACRACDVVRQRRAKERKAAGT
jgi:hypothetical protein